MRPKITKIGQNPDFPAKSSKTRFPAHLSTRSYSLGAFAYAYVRATNRLDTITFPNWQKTVFSYFDNTGDQRLKEINNYVWGVVSNRPVSDFQYTYNPVGTIATWQQQAESNPATQLNLGYDATDELTSAVQKDASASVVKSNAFQYDLAGNLLAETTLAGTTAGQFNGLNQLTSLNVNPPVQTVAGHTTQPAQNVSVNAVPATITQSTNFVASVPLPNGTNVVTISAQDSSGAITTQRTQVVTSGSSTGTTSALFYDANGNTGVDENGNRYTWDALNRVTAINYARGGQSQFVYDGLSRRVAIIERDATGATTSTKLFLWIGQTLAEERDVQNNVTKRFFAQGEQQAGVNYFYTRDHLGSVRELVDSNDNIVARYDYDVYGRITKVQGTNLADFQYAGYYQHAPSGLELTLYRTYDPNTGRWLSRDLYTDEDGNDPEIASGINLYGYANSDPIDFMDALGLQSPPRGSTGGKSTNQLNPGMTALGGGMVAPFVIVPLVLEIGPMVGPPLAAYLKQHISIDGPTADFGQKGKRGSSRICQIRWDKKPVARLDLNPDGKGIHLNIGTGRNKWHFPIWPPGWPY